MKKQTRPDRSVRTQSATRCNEPTETALRAVRGGADFDGLNAKADILVIGRG